VVLIDFVAALKIQNPDRYALYFICGKKTLARRRRMIKRNRVSFFVATNFSSQEFFPSIKRRGSGLKTACRACGRAIYDLWPQVYDFMAQVWLNESTRCFD